jgi:hypothetical protein
MSGKYEIIPPPRRDVASRRDTAVTIVSPPRVDPGGIVGSALTRWEAKRHARAITAVTARTRAETELLDAQSQLVDSYVRRQRAGYRLQELPEILASDRSRRRAERPEELRGLEHRRETSELQRTTELAHAQRVVVDAEQALRAQREHGFLTHRLAYARKSCELLDVELSAAERRAMLREHLAELAQPAEASHGLSADASEAEIDAALLEARSQLRASGLDTAKIDAVLGRRASRG